MVAAERALQIVDAQTRTLSVAQPGPRLGLPTPSEMESLKAYGQVAIASGMAPKHIDKWETAVVIMRYGHQLGVDEFTALQNMYVIGGKPSMMASLMHAMILRDHGDDAIHVTVSSAERCELVCKRRSASQSTLVVYTMAEANAAGLPTSNAVWKKYPVDMLFARAISRAGRQVFRDTTMGLYTPEEIGGNVVEAQGEIIETTGSVTHPVDIASAPERDKASDAQLDEMKALARQLGLTTNGQIKQRIGAALADITAADAQIAIDSMRAELSEIVESEANEYQGDENEIIDVESRELDGMPTDIADKYTS